MCCLNPTRPGIIEFVFRDYKNVDLWVVTMVGAGLFSLDCQQQGGDIFISFVRKPSRANLTFFKQLYNRNESDGFANCRDYWEVVRVLSVVARSRHVNPVFHIRRVYFPDFSRHISHLCFLSRCQREKEKQRPRPGVMLAFKERIHLYLF